MEENLFKSFASDYDTIFLVDLITGKMSIVQCKPEIEDAFSDLMKDGYDAYCEKFISNYLCPEDSEWFNQFMKKEYLLENVQKQGFLLVNYRLINSEKEVVHYQSKVTLVDASKDSCKVLLGGHCVDSAEKINLERLKYIDSTLQNAVIASLATDYDYICYIDVSIKHVTRFYASEVYKKIISKIDSTLNTYEKLLSLFKTIVYEEDFEQFQKDTDISKIMEQLEFLPSYEIFFRVIIEEQLFYYKLRIVKDKKNPQGIILGLISFDEQIRTKIQHKEQQMAHDLMEKQLEILLTERTAEIQEKNKVLNRINEDIIEMLGDVTEARDIESGEHIRRVKSFTQILAYQIMKDWPEYELTKEKIELIASASPLHDIGKISIPDAILLKPGKLTKEEFEIMKTHTSKGCELLKKAPKDWSPAYLETSIEICHFHHEKYDGKGYPLGLVGDEIPLSAQIVSLADCYDALTSKRVYKDAFDSDTAFHMILEGKCGAFNPKLLESFRSCVQLFEKQDFKLMHIEYGVSVNARENLNGKLILYAEDEEITRTIGREMLEGEGAVVIEAKNGKEALSIFGATSEGAFDALLIDVFMPDMSGIEVTKIIRSMGNEYAKTVPIVALTSSQNKEDLQQCLAMGMSAYLTKPVSVTNLSSVLLRLVNMK